MQKLKSFVSDNLLFFDTEFSSLNPYLGEILSFGAIKLGGESLYLELEHEGHIDDWPKQHVVPKLKQHKVSRAEAVEKIKDFIGPTKPFAVAFVDNYDNSYSHKLFVGNELPFDWMTVDFSSILFGLGYNPRLFLPDTEGSEAFYKKIGVDPTEFELHNAFGDASLLRKVWVQFFEV